MARGESQLRTSAQDRDVQTDTLPTCYGEIGSFEQLRVKYFQAIPNDTLENPNSTCGYPPEDAFKMLRNPDPFTSSFPWPGFLIGQTMSSLTYFCAEQVMVQRTLSAKSLSHAQGGCIFAGFCKILPVFMTVIPGMIARVLYTNTVACASAEACLAACGNSRGCSNTAYPSLVLGLMPDGLRGVMLAVMLSAIVSSLTSLFNSISTLFTVDIWQFSRQRISDKNPSNRELMIVGRVTVLVMTVLSVLWIPAIELLQGDNILTYFTRMQGRATPTIAAVYLLAVLWPRTNEKGAFWGLMIGAFVGLIRLILDFVYPDPVCWEEDTRPKIIKLHYFYFNIILFSIVMVSVIVISLLTEPLAEYRVVRTTFFSRYSKARRPDDQVLEDDERTKLNEQSGEDVKMEVNKDKLAEEDEDRRVRFCRRLPRGYPEATPRLSTVSRLNRHNLPQGTIFAGCCPEAALRFVAFSVREGAAVKTMGQRIVAWFCGYSEETAEAREMARQQALQNQKISTLKQDPRAKVVIYAGMVTLLGVVVFLYTFFSVDWL
ncbi:sodium/myo-inositol cotransporter 2-like [Diadema antillarum]|uniref:sodium/myo-inositol cotransporter 2-like n=1 Tax=Diadema antillarum TaxID=105358 RepID=UPI003A85D329